VRDGCARGIAADEDIDTVVVLPQPPDVNRAEARRLAQGLKDLSTDSSQEL